MKCKFCNNTAVYEEPYLCKEHFIEYYESKVYETIRKYNLFNDNDKILVATSGGKDSIAALLSLSKKYKVDALLIDEGISNYREYSKESLIKYCDKKNISLKIASFKEETNYELDEMVKKLNDIPCSICGVLRRYLLNKHSKDYDVIVTGHNLDDESQTVLMNLFKNQVDLVARSGVITGFNKKEGFTKKVKPLYFCREKENLLYVLLHNIKIPFYECPYAKFAFREKIKNSVLNIESRKVRNEIFNSFSLFPDLLKTKYTNENPNSNQELGKCSICKMPSENKICRTCLLKERLKRSKI